MGYISAFYLTKACFFKHMLGFSNNVTNWTRFLPNHLHNLATETPDCQFSGEIGQNWQKFGSSWQCVGDTAGRFHPVAAAKLLFPEAVIKAAQLGMAEGLFTKMSRFQEFHDICDIFLEVSRQFRPFGGRLSPKKACIGRSRWEQQDYELTNITNSIETCQIGYSASCRRARQQGCCTHVTGGRQGRRPHAVCCGLRDADSLMEGLRQQARPSTRRRMAPCI